ncbi:MAG: pyridoxamine 5'-phosphate oxidase family protein [Candidatus Dormibacteraeota bacterium]|nr:pyridoxamine 5'-phosphate oxidase family protein [Candidatus Dormibacteraeota bacterium]
MAGTDERVDLPSAVKRLAELPILTVVGTNRANGAVQMNPVWFEYRDGDFWVNSNTRRTWPRNVQRDGGALLLLVDPKVPDRFAQIRCRLAQTIADPQHAMIDRLAHRYTGKPFRELEPGEERITFKLVPIKVTGQEI